MQKNVCVYISSFDGYSDLWNTFFYIFDYFWSGCSFPVYLVNNTKQYKHNNVIVINTGEEICWFDRTIKSLKTLREDYVVFLLEDYFFSKQIDENEIDNLIEVMEADNIYYCRLSLSENKQKGLSKRKRKEMDYQHISADAEYPISLQPAIWNRDKLIEFLEVINGKTPWDFEYYFNSQPATKGGFYPGVLYDNRDILGYKNGVLRGKWIPSIIKYYKKLGINIDTSNRRVLSRKEYAKYILAKNIGTRLPKKIKKSIKNILNKLNISYL